MLFPKWCRYIFINVLLKWLKHAHILMWKTLYMCLKIYFTFILEIQYILLNVMSVGQKSTPFFFFLASIVTWWGEGCWCYTGKNLSLEAMLLGFLNTIMWPTKWPLSVWDDKSPRVNINKPLLIYKNCLCEFARWDEKSGFKALHVTLFSITL